MSDFTAYNNSVGLVTTSELEELSVIPRNEEVFMNFMRYIGLLDASDPRKTEGQKLIDRIFLLDKYKGLKNQSLNIFEYESQILDEGLEEGGQKTHINTMAPHQKVFVRDFDINVLHELINF
jgi:hypothetical protein